MPDQDAWRYCQNCHAMFFDGSPDKGWCPAGGGHVAQGYNFALPYDIPETPAAQAAWRYCQNCHAMFFDGNPDKGRCPNGGGHVAQGYEFALPYDIPETPTGQAAWRYCQNCHEMFFDGNPDKGRCPAGGGHVAQGFNFTLPHQIGADIPLTPAPQAGWRYCQNCHGMFFDGAPDKGHCPAGGGHVAQGYNFALPHDIPETPTAQGAWRYCQNCRAMFFDGAPDKGHCPAGGGHVAQGYNFALPHDVPETPTAQAAWRYCQNCHAMFFDGSPDKGRCPAGAGHVAQGYNFTLPHETAGFALGPKVFSGQITSRGLAALGGWVEVTLNPDGSQRWRGHAHDSGADGYDFGVSAVVRSRSGRAIGFAHHGHVGGTITSGSRNHDWDETHPPHPVIKENIEDFFNGTCGFSTDYSSDLGSTAEGALAFIGKFLLGSTPVGSAVGLVVFVGVEAGSLISTGSLVPGARVVGGVLWLAGPSNTLLALAAEGIASAASRTRELTQEEYDWANDEVYERSLPPRDRLILTDAIGPNNRAFTFPRFDNKITLNMGREGFIDPRNFDVAERRNQRGEVFIHELCHSWQIHHAAIDLAMLADALASRACEVAGTNPYVYGDAGPPYGTFNLEQQAQIVSDWFCGKRTGTLWTGTPKDPNSPYFGYIVQNIRAGTV